MDILDKFNNIDVDNTTRVSDDVINKIKEIEDKMNTKITNFSEQIDYLKKFRDSQCFDGFIETIEHNIISSKIDFIYNSKEIIESEYYLCIDKIKYHRVTYEDTLKYFDNEPTLNKMIDLIFETTEKMAVDEYEKKRAKELMFKEMNERWGKQLASFTKNGTVIFPEYIYIDNHGYESNQMFDDGEALAFSCNSSGDKFDIINLFKCLNLFENDSIETHECESMISFRNNSHFYIKSGKTVFDNELVDSITVTKKGNIKIKFNDSKNGLLFYEFLNLHNAKVYK